jgi:hypothetical protein
MFTKGTCQKRAFNRCRLGRAAMCTKGMYLPMQALLVVKFLDGPRRQQRERQALIAAPCLGTRRKAAPSGSKW